MVQVYPIAVFINFIFKHLMERLEEEITLCHNFYIDKTKRKRNMET